MWHFAPATPSNRFYDAGCNAFGRCGAYQSGIPPQHCPAPGRPDALAHLPGQAYGFSMEGMYMRIGASLVLIAIGAILKFAVTKPVSGIDVGAVGVILMIVGALGLAITLVLMSTRRRTDIIHHPSGTTYLAADERLDPPGPGY